MVVVAGMSVCGGRLWQACIYICGGGEVAGVGRAKGYYAQTHAPHTSCSHAPSYPPTHNYAPSPPRTLQQNNVHTLQNTAFRRIWIPPPPPPPAPPRRTLQQNNEVHIPRDGC